MLKGVNVAIGITGSIAAVRVVELAHEFKRRGANVRGIITSNATKIIHPWAVEYATGNEVVTGITGKVEHIELCGENGWADVLLIAPATANTIGKMAAAIDDTCVTTCVTTAIGSGIPIVVAPAMHEPMANHPGIIEAQERLESWGVNFADPVVEEGKAKIADAETIIVEVEKAVDLKPLEGKHIIVTSGSTREQIDPIRIITNLSSGKMGESVARGCYIKGAKVSLVHSGKNIPYVDTYQVQSAEEMIERVINLSREADVLVSAAAISDYGTDPLDQKLRSGRESIQLELHRKPKLVDVVRKEFPDIMIVGFKAETEEDQKIVIERSKELLERVGLAFVVANNARVMGLEDTEVKIIRMGEVVEMGGSKRVIGLKIAEELSREMETD
ncbi:MAG: bifunctional phosphopantothenoylcysteine decarboxylase/phosphopantothenate--cysteine ligase CoaBC [Halobacteriales archaeon]|nr:bifunctional phosphopantothenoylcysteine decarboxylase/phosphopantothenate--cysteine ligase CoaBC [Halobacteriales archaeon]